MEGESMGAIQERNTAIFLRWFDEGCSWGNVDVVEELYAPEDVSHSLPDSLPPTRDGLKAFVLILREGIPDLDCPVELVVAEGDRVAGRSRSRERTLATCSASRRRSGVSTLA